MHCNSYLLYKIDTGKKIRFVDYRLQLMREILVAYNIQILYLIQCEEKLLKNFVLYVQTPVEDLSEND